jgi:hypothetical protein
MKTGTIDFVVKPLIFQGRMIDILQGMKTEGDTLLMTLRSTLGSIQGRFESLNQYYQMVATLKLTEQQIRLAEREGRVEGRFRRISIVLGILVVFEVFSNLLAWAYPPAYPAQWLMPFLLWSMLFIALFVTIGVALSYRD